MIAAVMWAMVIVSLMFTFYTLAQFSERLGEALHLEPYYILYYVASLLLFIGIQTELLSEMVPGPAAGYAHWFGILTAIGMTVALMTTVRYWGWLIRAHH